MKLICCGDSNTYGYDPRSWSGDRYHAESRWVDLLREKTGFTVINDGENGREIPHRETTLSYACERLCRGGADLIVVMLGSNDLLQGADVQTVTARMESFLGRLLSAGQKILLIAPPPMGLGEWTADAELRRASEELGTAYRLLAERLHVSFADAGEWGIDLCYDGVHFTEAGSCRFAEMLAEVLTCKEDLRVK